MSAPIKACTSKLVHIKISFGTEGTFYFSIAFRKKSSEYNSTNGQRIIYQTFRIAFFVIKPFKIGISKCKKGRTEFRQYFQLFTQRITEQSQTTFCIVIVNAD